MDAEITPQGAAIFISYSSKDIEFVRKLDAALSINGGRVFLDERSIKVGDSIPQRVYDAIDACSYLIVVLSKNSLKSRWVNEELSAAKGRQNRSGELVIMPILIDACEVPAMIKHVRYAELIDWHDSRTFSRQLSALLSALELKRMVPIAHEVRYFLMHHAAFYLIGSEATRLAGYAEGARLADYAGFLGASEWNFARIAIKWLIDSELYTRTFGEFIERLREEGLDRNSDILSTLIDRLSELISRVDLRAWLRSSSSEETLRGLEDSAFRIGNMIKVMHEEYLSMVASQFL